MVWYSANFDETAVIYYITHIYFVQSCNSLDDEISESVISDGELPDFTQITIPDLSTWRVSIPRIGARPDPDNFKKQFFVFIIDIRRVDISEDNLGANAGRANWIVAR